MPPHKGIFFEIFCQIPLHRASNKQKGGRTWPRIWSSCTAATIRRCTATLCGSPAATFYRAMVALPDFRGECAASTWLCQIARNTWTSLRRKEGRCQPLDDTAALPDSRDFAAAFEDKDLALRIHRLLHRLPEPYREVFLLRVLGELSFRDIGSLFEKGENWACVTYHRARKKIMEQMEGTP